MNLGLGCLPVPTTPRQPLEVVERKGIGHPDTICDALAERFSVALSQYYLEHLGFIAHYNVDKVLLQGGTSLPRFGGGELRLY